MVATMKIWQKLILADGFKEVEGTNGIVQNFSTNLKAHLTFTNQFGNMSYCIWKTKSHFTDTPEISNVLPKTHSNLPEAPS